MTNNNLKERVNDLFGRGFENSPEDKLPLVARVVAEAYKDNMEGLTRYVYNANDGVSKVGMLAHHFLKGWGVLPNIKDDFEIADAIGNLEQSSDGTDYLDQFVDAEKYDCITSCGEVMPFDLETWLNEHPGASLETMPEIHNTGFYQLDGLARETRGEFKETMETLQFAYILEKHNDDGNFNSEETEINLAKTYMNARASLNALLDCGLFPNASFAVHGAINKLKVHDGYIEDHKKYEKITKNSTIELYLLAEKRTFQIRLLAEGISAGIASELDVRRIFSMYYNMTKDSQDASNGKAVLLDMKDKHKHLQKYLQQEENYETLRTTLLKTCRQYDQEDRTELLTDKCIDFGKPLFLDKPDDIGNVEYVLEVHKELVK